MMKLRLLAFIYLLLWMTLVVCGNEINSVFSKKDTKYIIQEDYVFTDTLFIPRNCELVFKGGKLSGPVVFDNNKLGGDVNLKGSSIKGKVRNKVFDASWLCAMDGVTDDASRVNEMIEVCGNVYFPKGIYRLKTLYNAQGKTDKKLISAIKAHIGICKSNVTLKGERGAEFMTDEPLGTICIFSQPNRIEKSVRNIKIENITFTVKNDGKSFYEFMHTIKLIGVNGMTIKNCVFNDFWGDAISLSHYGDTPQTGERTRNQNVKILNNTIVGGEKHNNRNGISVISGKNILISGNTIKNTSRKDMPGAIDVEPNNTAYTIENIRIVYNMIEGCDGTAGGICIHANSKGGSAYNIRIENNIVKSSTSGLAFVVNNDKFTRDYVIRNNYVDKHTQPYQFVGKGKSKNWVISGNTFERPCTQEIPGDIQVDNLVVKNNKKKD